MQRTVYAVPGMDCGAEEQLVRAALASRREVAHLEFDLAARRLIVWHEDAVEPVSAALSALNLGARVLQTETAPVPRLREHSDQTRVLRAVLGINFLFFLLEMVSGLFSGSMGLVADSLDMLADAFVYAISLLAVGGSLGRKRRVARTAGYFQILLALLGFAEVLRRFLGAERMPDFRVMIVVSALALGANTICLVLLRRSKGREEAHMRASQIFTSNDVIINLGVITAAVAVRVLHSSLPDLVVGAIVFVLVLSGARRILKLGGSTPGRARRSR